MSKRKKKTTYQKQKEEIYTFFKENTDRTYTLNDLYNQYNIYDNDEKVFVRLMIEELEEEGKLTSVGRDRYAAGSGSKNEVEGRVDFVNPRFAFIRYDDELKDVYIEADKLGGAMDGDLVRVLITKPSGKKSSNPEGKVIEILERGRKELVGTIKIFGNYALLKPEGKTIHEDFFIAKGNINDAKSNDLVIIKILDYPTALHQGTGEVVEILGKSGENNAEMHAIVAEFGFSIRFPKEVEEEAEAISTEIAAEEIAKRKDFREILTFTIDPIDAKDFDDALSYRILENGNIEVGVHIADVTHYVKEDSVLEKEAYSRATSVYLVDRTIPMLPEKLSNGLCSLRPKEEKLVFSAVFELNNQAKIVKEWFGRAVIYSDRRFTYEEAQTILEAEKPTEEDVIFYEPLKALNQLAKILKTERFKKGAINFETTEVKFRLNEAGTPLGIYIKERKDAHKLIEEFMLLANKQVAEFVYNKPMKKPKKADLIVEEQTSNTMVYRIHEPPNPEKLETFAKFAARVGFSIKTGSQNALSQSLNGLMTEIEGTPMQNVLEQLAVRTMSKARYSTNPIGHFGLAFDHYSHFTSPIRRYPDMMAHRLLQHYLDGKTSPDPVYYEEKCKHSSDREKQAAEAERASIKYKQVEFMSLQDAQNIYDGIITGVTDFGIFVEMVGTGCEGLVRMTDLSDDYYEYDADNYRLVGQRKGRIINFGDAVKVKVKTTDIQNRSIDLVLDAIGEVSFKKTFENVKTGRRKKDAAPRGRGNGRRRR